MADAPQTESTPQNQPVQDSTGTLVDQSQPTTKSDDSTKSESSSTQTPPEVTDSSKKEETSLANDKDEKKDDAKPEGAPEKYEPFKAPEGFEFDASRVEAANNLFKELNLSQEQAQKAVDMFGKELADAIEAPYTKYQEIRDGWRGEIVKDPALGNGTDGLKPEVKAAIGRVIDNGLGPDLGPKFREAMDFTGAGDNPAFVRAMVKLAEYVSEGSAVKGGGPVAPASKKPTAAQSMYPNLPSAAG